MKKFNHIKLPELQFDLVAETTDSGRKYFTPSGKAYPSITTVLSSYNKKALFEWRARVGEEVANKISRKAAGRGTKLHTICENYLLNEITDMKMKTMMPDTKELFLSVRPFMDIHVDNIYGIEQSLYSDRLKVAGRCDCIAEWDGELSIIDWKTASRQKEKEGILNYFMQASAYAEMFTEITKKEINQIVIVIAVEGDEPQVFIENKNTYIDSLEQYLHSYYIRRT